MDKQFQSPFRRPWLEDYGAAAAGGGKGLKGIIAGRLAYASVSLVRQLKKFNHFYVYRSI